MAHLEFEFNEFIEEATLFVTVASDFLTPTAIANLTNAVQEMRSYRYSQVQHPQTFEVLNLESYPLMAPVQGGKATESVYLDMTIEWPYEKVASAPSDRFKLVNDAKTAVEVVRFTSEKTLSSWVVWLSSKYHYEGIPNSMVTSTFESFQADPNGEEPNPKDQLHLPFIPTIPISPFAVAEFAFAELAPETWLQATQNGAAGQSWRLLQRRRLDRYLSWMTRQVRLNPITPILALRRSRPRAGLFQDPPVI